MPTRIQIAKPDILKAFEAGPRVLKQDELGEMFRVNRDGWRLARSMTLGSFEEFMLSRTPLREVRYEFPHRALTGYTWGEVHPVETLMKLLDRSYLSHYSAVRIHGLTEQLPKTIYVTQEKKSGGSYEPQDIDDINQEAIDTAFQRPARVSQNEVIGDGYRIILLHGADQGEVGVMMEIKAYEDSPELELRYTTLERTLIDIAVRPAYAGGVFEVAKAYRNASARGLSVNTLAATLKRMKFAYPYHQVVGFYLEHAGYKSSLVDMFQSQPMKRDFYLTNAMGETKYVEKWRLHVPEGF